ncbi:hypothetical protein KUCAC02_001482, partial [Chaenocephalus aceratus]
TQRRRNWYPESTKAGSLSLYVDPPWAKEKIKTNGTLINGPLLSDRRSPLQEGCLKSKLPARHLLLRRS